LPGKATNSGPGIPAASSRPGLEQLYLVVALVHRDKLVALVAAIAIPAIYQFRDFTAAGGLMSYDPDIFDAYRQIGVYAGKILKGALPCQSNRRQNSNWSSTSRPPRLTR
jgi:hypothetical protein